MGLVRVFILRLEDCEVLATVIAVEGSDFEGAVVWIDV